MCLTPDPVLPIGREALSEGIAGVENIVKHVLITHGNGEPYDHHRFPVHHVKTKEEQDMALSVSMWNYWLPFSQRIPSKLFKCRMRCHSTISLNGVLRRYAENADFSMHTAPTTLFLYCQQIQSHRLIEFEHSLRLFSS